MTGRPITAFPIAGFGRRVRRDRRGVNALEFALVATIFMFFIGAIFDIGILLFQQSMIDNATLRASRLIRTGQIQLAGTGSTMFTTQLCNDLTNVVDSCANIQYKVTAAATFAALSGTVSLNSTGTLAGAGTFTPGTAGQDVIVQVAWRRPYIVPWVGNVVNPGGNQVLTSVVALRNELYN